MSDKQDRIGEYIRNHPRLGPYAATAYARPWPPPTLPHVPPANQLADEFLQDAEFAALELATWLGTTDGQLIAEAVGQVIPPGYEPVYSLTVDALQIAARRQTEVGRRKAGVLAFTILTGGLLIAIALSDS